jgi:hypothetical protein
VAFSLDGRFVACLDRDDKKKAFDVASGAALPGAPSWKACLVVEREIVKIHRVVAVLL